MQAAGGAARRIVLIIYTRATALDRHLDGQLALKRIGLGAIPTANSCTGSGARLLEAPQRGTLHDPPALPEKPASCNSMAVVGCGHDAAPRREGAGFVDNPEHDGGKGV